MTDHEIIRKAVDKASKNGYTGWKSFVPAFPPLKVKSKRKLEELFGATLLFHKEKIIYSHDFAKAFWGEKGHVRKYLDGIKMEPIAWKYHLQEMVILEEPMEYLEKYL